MIIFSKPNSYNLSDSIVTIGAFDGVHRGHVLVLNNLKFIAEQKGLQSVAVTFEEHPKHLYHPKEQFKLLSSKDEKIGLIRKTGIDALAFISFDYRVSNMNYIDFIRNILIKKFYAKAILMGYDNHFGKGGEGSFKAVSEKSSELDVEVIQIDELNPDDHISSSKIRKSLVAGDIKTATRLLGYCYGFEAYVVKGNKIASEMGFPTANLMLSCSEKIMPSFGVYATKAFFDNKLYHGILNYGIKPTVNKEIMEPIAELHIFNFSGNLYGKIVRVELVDKIRHEIKFDSIDELKNQIVLDIQQTNAILSNN